MSRVYLHSKNDRNSLNKLMLYLFVVFIIYGFYKNGIKLYIAGYVNVIEMFKSVNKDNVLEYDEKINNMFENIDNGFLNTKTIYKVKKDAK